MYEFYQKNRSYCICTIILIVLCLAGAWLYHDYTRNDTDYHNTDTTMADVDKRISDIADRLDTMQKRLDETQKTVNGVAERVERSRENAETVAGGIVEAERRLDEAIARSQRIESIIKDIERTNK